MALFTRPGLSKHKKSAWKSPVLGFVKLNGLLYWDPSSRGFGDDGGDGDLSELSKAYGALGP